MDIITFVSKKIPKRRSNEMIMAVRIEKALKTLYFTNSTDKEWIA